MKQQENTIESAIVAHEVGGIDGTAIDARQLHAFLEVGKDFSTWIKDRIEQFGFVADLDYVLFDSPNLGNQRGRGGDRRSVEYALTVDMAKELSMVERNAQGKAARLYFIEMEKKAKALAGGLPKSLPEALRMAAALAERNERYEAELKALAPKVEFHDHVAEATNAQNLNEVAKVLGTGQNRFFNWLREAQILFKKGTQNLPYQNYIDSGYFRVIERQFVDGNGETRTYTRVLVTGKGLIWLQKKWTEQVGKAA